MSWDSSQEQQIWRFRRSPTQLSHPAASLLEATAQLAAKCIHRFNLEDIDDLPPDLAQVLVDQLLLQKRLNFYTLSLFKTQFLYSLDLTGCEGVSNEWLFLLKNSPLQTLILTGCKQVW